MRDAGLLDSALGWPLNFLACEAIAGPQLLGSSDVKTYPCDCATGINRQLTNETPNPVPGRDLKTSPLGSIVYVAVREGILLGITRAVMARATTGQAVVLRTPVTTANDPYGPCISVTNDATPVSRNFVFTTGS